MKYIHDVLQPSPLPTSRTFHHPRLELCTLLAVTLPSSLSQPPVTIPPSVSMNPPILGTLSTWNHTVCLSVSGLFHYA